MDPVLQRRVGGIFPLLNLLELRVREAVSLGVRQAPVGIAVIRLALIRRLVGAHGRFKVSHRLLGMPGLQVQFVPVGVGFKHFFIQPDGILILAQPQQRGGEDALEHGVVRFSLQQQSRLFVSLLKPGLLDQDVEIINPGLDMMGGELHATFQQEFGVVVNFQPDPYLRQQAHGFNVVFVFLQEIPAQSLGLVQLILVHEVHDMDQGLRQLGEEIQPLPVQPGRLLPAGSLMQVHQGPQARLQGGVELHRPGVGPGGVLAPVEAQKDMALLLPGPGVSGIVPEQGMQGLQGVI